MSVGEIVDQRLQEQDGKLECGKTYFTTCAHGKNTDTLSYAEFQTPAEISNSIY